MPPRPSRNLDQALLAAGRELFASRGCSGLSVREVADAAGVNLGMFHYHFKTREAFLRAVLQGVYEEMYAELSALTAAKRTPDATATDQLRAALRFMGRFVRSKRPFLARVLADALCGEALAREFLRDNFPRHLGVMHGLIMQAQAAGEMRAMPFPQAMGFCIGSLAMPILFAGAVAESGMVAAPMAKFIEDALLVDAALDQRIELALHALAADPATPKRKAVAKTTAAKAQRAPRTTRARKPS